MGVTQTKPDAAEGCVGTLRPTPSRTLVLKQVLEEEEGQERTGKRLGRWAPIPPFSWGFPTSMTTVSHLFRKWIARDPHTASHRSGRDAFI